MCIQYSYKLFLKFSLKCIDPNYLFYCFKCVHRVCPNLSSAPCSVHIVPMPTRVSVPSSELGPPTPSFTIDGVSPLGPKVGEEKHSLAGDGVGWGNPIWRLERMPATMYSLWCKLWIYLMPCFLFQVASSTWTTNMLRLDPTFNAGKTKDIFPHSCNIFPCINYKIYIYI
jgi:hypothetical protein